MRGWFAVALLSAVTAAAAEPAAPLATPAAKPPPLVSPEVLPDHRVVFRLRAPQATQVTITGDFWVQENRTDSLVKDASGVWSLTTEPLPPDLYSYAFNVDGVPIPDPSNGQLKQGIRTQQSLFAVPGGDEAFLENAAVPHGEVRTVLYHPSAGGAERGMYIYFPPNYDRSNARYPVVYLFHGGGDDDWGWVTVGRVNTMLDNLIAQGKARPMIVVMPSLWALDAPVSADRSAQNEAAFRKGFFADVVPYVEGHYRVLSGAAHRAVGGLGIGRDMLPDFIWPSLQQFDTVFFVSGGTDEKRFAVMNQQYPGVIDDPRNVRRVRFFLGDGANDNSVTSSRDLATELKRRGYQVTTYETSGTHGWPSFRRCFAQFAQGAFR